MSSSIENSFISKFHFSVQFAISFQKILYFVLVCYKILFILFFCTKSMLTSLQNKSPKLNLLFKPKN